MTQHMRPDDPDDLMNEDELLQAVGDWVDTANSLSRRVPAASTAYADLDHAYTLIAKAFDFLDELERAGDL